MGHGDKKIPGSSQALWSVTFMNNKDLSFYKVESQDQHLMLSSDLHMHVMACAYIIHEYTQPQFNMQHTYNLSPVPQRNDKDMASRVVFDKTPWQVKSWTACIERTRDHCRGWLCDVPAAYTWLARHFSSSAYRDFEHFAVWSQHKARCGKVLMVILAWCAL